MRRTNHRKMYNHTLAPKIPSQNCKQHLSPAQLEERTQNNRMARHQKMLEHHKVSEVKS